MKNRYIVHAAFEVESGSTNPTHAHLLAQQLLDQAGVRIFTTKVYANPLQEHFAAAIITRQDVIDATGCTETEALSIEHRDMRQLADFAGAWGGVDGEYGNKPEAIRAALNFVRPDIASRFMAADKK